MSSFKTGLARQFNRGSSTYDLYADLQKLMSERLVQRLTCTQREFTKILELGCGTGSMTAQLIAAFPDAHITAIDLASEMVLMCRARLAETGRLELRVADAETTEWTPACFDLIVSNATIQWFEHPAESLRALVEAMRPGGLMCHSTFGQKTFADLHEILGEVESDRGYPVPQSYGLPLMTADSWERHLRSSGLSQVQVSATLERQYYPGLIDHLRALKGVGAAFAPSRGIEAGARYGILREVTRRYNERFVGPDGVFVTYEVLEISGVA